MEPHRYVPDLTADMRYVCGYPDPTRTSGHCDRTEDDPIHGQTS